ncbi:hypothetical protein MMC08_004051 [Hypocenomyce scalaris]|nr:hypothetical protein [Hypocenomyce scalaris]
MLDFSPLGDEIAQVALIAEMHHVFNDLQRVQNRIWVLRGVSHREKEYTPPTTPARAFWKQGEKEYQSVMEGLRRLIGRTKWLSGGNYRAMLGFNYSLIEMILKSACQIHIREELENFGRMPDSPRPKVQGFPEEEQMDKLLLAKQHVLLKELTHFYLLVGEFKRDVIAMIDLLKHTMYASS